MFLVINILQIFVFDSFGVPFWFTVSLFMLLINLYTFKGGIKTIVWTDTLQTTFLLACVGITFYIVRDHFGLTLSGLVSDIYESDYSQMIFGDWQDKRFYLKQLVSGAFIAIVMTGLDQDMMQKNLSCRNLRDAQKNIITLSWILVPVNLLFLMLGAALAMYANQMGIVMPGTSDTLFPEIALNHLGVVAGIVFIIGLTSAAYSSADSALTALTTSFSVDILGINRNNMLTERQRKQIRYGVHFSMATLLILVIIAFKGINNEAVIAELFTVAGYTYGPLLGLFTYGLFTRRPVSDRWVPFIAILSPLLCYLLSSYSVKILWGYKFGFELLIINGLLTFFGLWLSSLRMLPPGKVTG